MGGRGLDEQKGRGLHGWAGPEMKRRGGATLGGRCLKGTERGRGLSGAWKGPRAVGTLCRGELAWWGAPSRARRLGGPWGLMGGAVALQGWTTPGGWA